jgi:hypothetical protein
VPHAPGRHDHEEDRDPWHRTNVPELDARFSAPGACLDVVIERTAQRVADESVLRRLADAWRSKYEGDWSFDVANGAFQHDGGEALVFEVVPANVLAFAKGDFAQTRFRFSRLSE